jgi:hypothetical protein
MQDTQNILEFGAVITILKWAITILAAGFIAHFGKQFAEFIIAKIRDIRKKKSAGNQDAEAAAITGVDAIEAARLKLEKKIAKAAAKEKKKNS